MDYELAKELQDAGFSQTGNGKRVVRPDAIVARRDDFAYVPTLEELIEACGDITIHMSSYSKDAGDFPRAHCGSYEGDGSSLAEAVARLWLALNTK
jgi:hypothetical protein